LKVIGVLLLLMAGLSTGVLLVKRASQREKTCRELVRLCDALMTDIRFRATPMPLLLEQLLDSGNYPSLGFISPSAVAEKAFLQSPLKEEENREIAVFLYSLGKSDSASQLQCIQAFQREMQQCAENYSERLKRDGRLYITFGVFVPLLVSLVLL